METLKDSPRFQPRESRALALCVVASLAVHAALLLALPDSRLRHAGHVEVLEVRLEKHEPPRVVETARAVREQPREDRRKPVVEKSARAIAQPAPIATRPDEPPPQVLALPMKPSEPEPAFTVPAMPTDAARGEGAPRRDVAKAAAPAEGPPAEPRTTPPNFNAAYLRNPPPNYPVSARRNGEQGTVTLKVLVTRDGLPANVSVHTTSGSAGLDQAAIEAVKGWRFTPARQGTQPVEAPVLVPIVFRLEG